MTTFLNQNIYLVSFAFSFIAFFLLCLGIVQYLNSRKIKTKMIKKIQQDGYNQGTPLDTDKVYEHPLSGRKPDNPLISFFSLFSFSTAKSSDAGSSVKLKFLRAGIAWKNIDTAFMGAKLFLPVFFVAVFVFLRIFVFKVMGEQWMIFTLVFLGLAGFYLPEIWLKQKADKRQILIFKGLPDALDLLVVCVEAGMGLDSAINRVGKEMETAHPDLSREFSLMNLEMRAGKQRQDALRNLASRTGIDEMNSLVTLLIQTDKFGTSVATALKVFSDSFMTKRFQKAEEMAAKLPVTMLIPLMVFIFPALFVVILGPAAISIYQNLILK
jgi:tight adherence protein C